MNLRISQLLSEWSASTKRLIILDYDGTLVPLAPRPELAVPDIPLMNLLQRLSSVATIAIVSGRPLRDMQAWFGAYSFYLIAEHGALVRNAAHQWTLSGSWETRWKAAARSVLELFLRDYPLSFVEEKAYALAWHYRALPEHIATCAIADLVVMLETVLPVEAELLMGHKVVELRSRGIHKGLALSYLLPLLSPDFVLVAGDDDTDEDMFRAVRDRIGSYSIHMGSGPTEASDRLAGVSDLRLLLSVLYQEL